jgi:hypothetical protein
VIVETAETFYEGRLVEVGEEEVSLESDMGWVVVPVQRVTSIREKD